MNSTKNLIERLRGRPKRAPKEVWQHYLQQVEIAPEISCAEFVLNIRDATDMEKYFARLSNLTPFTNFLQEMPFGWAIVRLENVCKILDKIRAMNDFDDEDFNFNLACKVRDIAAIMLEIFNDAKNSSSAADSRIRLQNLVEDYLSDIGLTKKIFTAGDSFDDWANLSMKNSLLMIATDKRELNSKIAAVEIQPHVINYRNEHGDTEQLTFGGLCKVYKFREV